MKRLKRKKKTYASDYFKAHQGDWIIIFWKNSAAALSTASLLLKLKSFLEMTKMNSSGSGRTKVDRLFPHHEIYGIPSREVAGLTRRAYYSSVGGIYTTSSIDTVTGKYKDSIETTKSGKNYILGLLEDLTVQLLEECLDETDPEIDDLVFPLHILKGLRLKRL